ncbi:hypothetical protein [Thiothrix nivea]|uniref:Uncharacterized protein n=1 Tax=Thiothrix nivea (strain ATCC 35100 / DSM 5205 / JP2) TaxID=870187 RepID=A0A656HNW6_THINJ|nr:hypothetical protein [Thiothrix nivea]EIJ37060.1 hypothetical protein Thini_0051 [Thiothrix nivea DSM 5205]
MQLPRRGKTRQPQLEPLVWYFSTLRWLPLWVFSMAGVADCLAQLHSGGEIRWLFPLVCTVWGLLLFRYGCLLVRCQTSRPEPKQNNAAR